MTARRHLAAVPTATPSRQGDLSYDPTERFVTKDELARHLGFSRRWVEARLADGLPHHRIGRAVRFQVSTATEWLLTNQPMTTRED